MIAGQVGIGEESAHFNIQALKAHALVTECTGQLPFARFEQPPDIFVAGNELGADFAYECLY